MELELLEKKIRRLVAKLNKYNVHIEVFEYEDIEFGQILGKGGEGVVRKCTVTYNDLPVDAAVKTLVDNSDDCVNITLDEIELLCLAKDPIIGTTLSVYGVAAVPDENDPSLGKLVIITEVGLMNSLQLVQKEVLPLNVIYRLFGDIAAAIHTLHSKKIIHQDIKPENILITNITRGTGGQVRQVSMRVIDLGMGKRVFTEKVICDDILGTNGYHAPEVLLDDAYDFRADIFMLGVTFAVMLHSPEFLQSSKLPTLLKSVHAAKQKKITGRDLFEFTLEPTLIQHTAISQRMKTMLCTMMERVERRTMTLAGVVDLCRQEAEQLQGHSIVMSPVSSPCNCQDSGIFNGDHHNSHSNNTSTNNSFTNTLSAGSSVQKPSVRQTRARRGRPVVRHGSSISYDSVTPPKSVNKRRKRKTATSEIQDQTPIFKRLRSGKQVLYFPSV